MHSSKKNDEWDWVLFESLYLTPHFIIYITILCTYRREIRFGTRIRWIQSGWWGLSNHCRWLALWDWSLPTPRHCSGGWRATRMARTCQRKTRRSRRNRFSGIRGTAWRTERGRCTSFGWWPSGPSYNRFRCRWSCIPRPPGCPRTTSNAWTSTCCRAVWSLVRRSPRTGRSGKTARTGWIRRGHLATKVPRERWPRRSRLERTRRTGWTRALRPRSGNRSSSRRPAAPWASLCSRPSLRPYGLLSTKESDTERRHRYLQILNRRCRRSRPAPSMTSLLSALWTTVLFYFWLPSINIIYTIYTILGDVFNNG